jgi:trans-2,3-dihydro-3-hydroxyanthranilate isomerase
MSTPVPATVPFAFVDVFTTVPLAGNPLAVVPYLPGLPGAALPRLAREFNQSETTFLFPATVPGADWRLRSFTPAGIEVFGAGHNALGAWWWLAARGHLDLRLPSARFHQQLGAQVLPLTIHSRNGQPLTIGLEQSAPRFGAQVADHPSLARALGISEADLAIGTLPAQVVATDVAHLMVPVQPDALARLRPEAERIAALVSDLGGEGCYVFSTAPQSREATADARFFNPGVGIGEDPATGTAAGPLAALLVRHGIATGSRVIIDQGEQTGRPSRLEVTVNGEQIELLGSATLTAEGTIRIA